MTRVTYNGSHNLQLLPLLKFKFPLVPNYIKAILW
uniref:Uncharacterized protein n=1 Tax=Lepeophtheirus salmonis TaxID=72036 RepID=A0A0K2T6J4_LEPSM